ncbi:MAG: hypothetical protein WD059_09540 [Balneolaceae bacterium]
MMIKNKSQRSTSIYSVIICGLIFTTIFSACKDDSGKKEEPASSILNLNHLDHLGEVVTLNGEEIRLIHIYAEAPDYHWVGDSDEGVSCVDDVARAAIVYLRHFELTGNEESAEKAKQLLRFVLYMQTEEGLFHNFVFSNKLDKNTTHQNSVADKMNWWAGRAIWALGTGAKVLADHDTSFSQICLTAIDKSVPHIEDFLTSYPNTKIVSGYEMPEWLVSNSASDASSELLLGLTAANTISASTDYQNAINKISEGIAMMQYGNLSEAPYGAHISWQGGWHGWGNSQTMALSDADYLESAKYEAEHFYPWLLVNGWLHSFELQNPQNRRYYEQIAYAVRPVSVGLIRLYEKTNNEDYAILAGLAASWLTGNNVTGEKMYNPLHGYGYDGINDASTINMNSGAESTIEANMTILEVEQYPVAAKWMYAVSEEPQEIQVNGKNYTYKIFRVTEGEKTDQIAIMLNLSDASYEMMNVSELDQFINN